MEQGLAQSVSQPTPRGQGRMEKMQGPKEAMPKGRMPKNPTPAPTGVNDVVQMLLQGADPDELIDKGIPMDMIQKAIEIILAEEEGMEADVAEPSTEAGLAAMMGEEPRPRGM